MITGILSVFIALPISLLVIGGFFHEQLHLSGKLVSKTSLTFILLHSVGLSSGLGSLYMLLGYDFTIVQWLLLIVAITVTDYAIALGLRP